MSQKQKTFEFQEIKNSLRERLILTSEELFEAISNKEKEINKLGEERNELQKLDKKIRDEINDACFENPKVGDFWHECYSPVLVVVQVHENGDLTVCQNTKSVDGDPDSYTFDVSKSKKITRQEFSKIMKFYSFNPDKIGYNVIPERCNGIFEQWQNWIAESL